MNLAFQFIGTCGSMRPVRIASLELHNVGIFDQAILHFPPPNATTGNLVLFEGPNGTGKSTIIEAIASMIGRDTVNGICTTSAPLVGRFPANNGSIVLAVEHVEQTMHVSIEQRAAQTQGHLTKWSRPDGTPYSGAVADAIRGYLYADRGEPTDPKTEWAAFMYRPHGRTQYHSAKGFRELSRTAISGSLSGALDEQSRPGTDLLQMVVNLENARIRNTGYAVEELNPEVRLKKAAASKEAIDRLRTGLSAILGKTVTFKFINDEMSAELLLDGLLIRPDEWGEGMRSTLSWLTDLLVRLENIRWNNDEIPPWDQEFWLLLDEIEESLHPKRQMEILPALRKLFPNAHIYATTHSPFVVSSVGEGHVFSIRPDPRTRRVSGEIKPTPLQPGQSLDWIIKHVFDIQSPFMDVSTRDDLSAHDNEVTALVNGNQALDWSAFLARRERLLRLNAHVATIVLMRELSVRDIIDEKAADDRNGT